MAGVHFQFTDAAILFCLPEPGCNLCYLVERYTCFERIAVPSYETVAGCLGRAAQAGAMPIPTSGLYRLTKEWFTRIHRRDAEFTASEYAMIEFADELEAQEWPAVGQLSTRPNVVDEMNNLANSSHFTGGLDTSVDETKASWRASQLVTPPANRR